MTGHSGCRFSRREALIAVTACGAGGALFHRTLAAMAEQQQAVTREMVAAASWVCDLEFSEQEQQELAADLEKRLNEYRQLRELELDYITPPALTFIPTLKASSRSDSSPDREVRLTEAEAVPRPADDTELAFLPVAKLARLVEQRSVSSLELTRLYLQRLEKYDRLLRCVVTRTEDLALRQARKADEEIAAGEYRGPLHGIPWGAKDLIAVPGYPTTWGAEPYREQVLADEATVATRLEQAGAVLVAKLSLGNLALGDQWFGGKTRNPWNPEEGASGSSAGSAAAVVAGLVGFAIGSETLGSIVSPCRRCGATGLRPTFGRVSRHGCMPLSWSMDKLGPIARSVEDCALVLAAIHGDDTLDPAAVTRPFRWPPERPLTELRGGYFETDTPRSERSELQVLESLGVTLVPTRLPDRVPARAVTLMLDVEAAAMFDELTRAGQLDGLHAWPRTFRAGQFVPAIEYIRAARARTLLARDMEEYFDRYEVDFYVGGADLAICNLTGHPSIVLPSGVVERKGHQVPATIKMTGRLYDESTLLAVGHAFEKEGDWNQKRPEL